MSLPISLFAALLLLTVLQLVLQKCSPLFAFLLSLAGAVLLAFRIGDILQPVFAGLALFVRRTDGQAFRCLVRCAGILLITDYTRTLCQEAGADFLGWCADFVGRCLVLAAAFPLLEEIGGKIWGIAG